jgi:antitoxin component of MazEF toxin-antitoxin module
MSQSLRITIEDWDGDGAIRIPDAALQELGVDVGDSV